jgi:hypothetical protein
MNRPAVVAMMVLLVSALLCTALGVDLLDAAALCTAQRTGSFFLAFGRTNFTLSWSHDCAAQTTEFAYRGGKAPGWVAFGLCDREPKAGQEEMVGCEFFQFNGDLESRNSGNNTANGEPKALAQNMMQNVTVAVVDARYDVKFSRAWLAVDDAHASLSAKQLRVMASFGPTSFFGVQHFGDARFTMPGFQQLFGEQTSTSAIAVTTESGATPTASATSFAVTETSSAASATSFAVTETSSAASAPAHTCVMVSATVAAIAPLFLLML